MNVVQSARPHGAVIGALLIAGFLAFVVPIQGSDSGVVPPEGCTCHSDNPDLGVQVTVEAWPAVYTPLESYPLVVSAVGVVPGSEGGFSVEVTKGSLSSPDPLVLASGRYATHTGPDARAWSVVWLAPQEDSGGVTLTAFVNLVNGDGSEGPEDLWNVGTFTAVERAPEPPKPSYLVLAAHAEDGRPIAGRNFTLAAHLTNFTNASIPNAVVTFAAHLSFGVLPIGESRTDADGVARINWSVVSEGEFLYLAHYDGSSKNESSNATATVHVSDPDRVFERYYGRPSTGPSGGVIFDPVRIPLGAIVGGVWLTFAYATVLILRVRRAGAPAEDGPRDLIRLLVPRLGIRGRKKP